MSTDQPPLIAHATRDLAQFGAALHFEQIPQAVVERIKLSLLDSLGCCLYGASLPWTRKVAQLAQAEGAQPVASLIGLGTKTSPALAALVNGTSGHAFELDDIHKESIIHAGSIATPVALALAQARPSLDTDLCLHFTRQIIQIKACDQGRNRRNEKGEAHHQADACQK